MSTLKERIEELQIRFEGKEAIYVEKGALRVRVTKIRFEILDGSISAEVEEIPTPGLPIGPFPVRPPGRRTPLWWKIGAGYLTTFSEHCWYMGYGGWSLFFDPRTIQGVIDLSSRFPDNATGYERYKQVLHFLMDHAAYEPSKPVSA